MGTRKDDKWKEFEKLVAAIYMQATPDATVQHNYFTVGKSGRRRQIDVSINARQGLHNYLTVVECKRYTRRVGIRDVEAFITKLHDVRADKGVMVSVVGFDEGAQAQAKQHNVTLFSYREAVETDWQKVASSSLWITITTERFVPEYVLAELLNGKVVQIQPFEELPLGDTDFHITGLALAESMMQEHPALANTAEAVQRRGPGAMWIRAKIRTSEGPIFVQQDDQLWQIGEVTIQGNMLIRDYAVNPSFGSGHIIEDVLTGQKPFTEVSSMPFNIHALMRSQEGRAVTLAEYRAPNVLRHFISPEISDSTTQLRLTITSSGSEAPP